MEFDAVEMLRERHPAWRLLRAQNASLRLSFLGRHFVEGNRGAAAEQSLVGALEEHLHLLNRRRWTTPAELRLAIVTWIETTYHRRRRSKDSAD